MGDSGDSTRNAYPLLRITLTLLPLALLLALWRLMPVQRVQAQGIDPVGVVTLEVLESMAPREWTEPCPLLMRMFGRCTTTTFRSASVQPNPRFGTVQYWPRAAEPIPVHAFCRQANARTAPDATIQRPRRGEITVRVLVGPHGQMLDAQVDASSHPTHPLIDHYAKRMACHLAYRPAMRNGQPYAEWRAVRMRFVAEPARIHTPDEMPTPTLTPPRLARTGRMERYPPAALRQGIEGTVGLRILVDELGQVRYAEIEHGVHPLLDEAALRWAYRVSYEPATRDGIPYAEWHSESLTFKLNG